MADAELLVLKDNPLKHTTTLVLNRPSKGNSLTGNMNALLVASLDKCAFALSLLNRPPAHLKSPVL